ncbi:hypothetical protein [Streptomyces caatingaensis]|uniref:Membrane protein n=1 Tax=Streptomyces caatingaensis TaxID=1678637 RepID=A0A0K9XH07_9ACTN|nr:hypothetical protein [Streptomyces caatingaensis]KNB52548.1 membrane protein [Streptomyces caatingaensis]
MNINWAALGQVFGVSVVTTVALVGVFTLGIVGTAPRKGGSGGASALVRSGAYACYAACAAAVGYGIYLIVA